MSWIEKRSFFSLGVAIFIAVFIFYVSSLIVEPGTGGQSIKPLIYHSFIFTALSFFLSIAIIRAKNVRLAPLVILIGILYGVSDELHQLLVPGRLFSGHDIFLDTTGVLIGITAYLFTLDVRNII